MNFNICGKILKTHGLKGEVKVLNSSDFPRFVKGKKVYYLKNNEYLALTIKDVKDTKPLIVSFKEFDDINQVLPLIGLDLYALREKDDLASNEYYYSDLIGKDIYNEDGLKLIKISDVILLPQGHYLVGYKDNKRKLIPFNEHFIKDVLEDRIIIYNIEGLI